MLISRDESRPDSSGPSSQRRRGITRRQFLLDTGALLLGAASSYGYATRIEPHWLQFVERTLPVDSLPESLVGAKLVQLSDIHVGPFVSDDYVLATFERVKALEPDIVVMTGDFASSLTSDVSHCARIYEHFPHGRLGTLGVLGNHDYGHAWCNERAADRLAATLSDSGITVLRNSHASLSGLQIIGIDDLWARHFDVKAALSGVDPARAMLALSHNPDSADRTGWEGFRGQILSGHTHGGQCRPPFLPPPFLPVENRRYTAGQFRLDDARNMYINRGVGHLTEARFLVRPEVTVFRLERA